jgi:hypothetical protein
VFDVDETSSYDGKGENRALTHEGPEGFGAARKLFCHHAMFDRT